MANGKVVAGIAGGVFVVAAGVLGYLFYDAYSSRTETEQELEDGIDSYRRMNAAAVFPSRKSIDAVVTNQAVCAAWRERAENFASRGDRVVPQDETPASFKQRLANEVRRLVALPGGVEGHLAAPNFYFGFEKYLGESAVLPEAAAVPRLSEQLAAISRFAEIFAESGVVEVKSVRREEAVAKKDDDEDPKPRKSAKGRKTADEADGAKMTSLEYAVSILVRPSAFVETLNALTADQRFTVVKGFAFHSTGDMIVDRLNAAEALLAKKDEPQNARRRRRRGSSFAEESAAEQAPKGDDRLVVDPELDAPVQVDMKLVVYDFGRAAVAAAEAPAADAAAAKPADKKEAK